MFKTDKLNRALIFWSVCIPVRTFISYKAMKHTWLRAPAALIAYMWLSGSHSDAVEGAFGGHAWWAEERPVHGLAWGAYAATGMWEFLALDTAGGAINWFTTSDSSL
jgi:hypothetical protein